MIQVEVENHPPLKHDELEAACGDFLKFLGKPLLEIWYPVTPVRRPSGKPFHMSAKQRDLYLRRGGKHARYVRQADEWERLGEFREAIEFWTKKFHRGEAFGGAIFAYMEFHRVRPKSHGKMKKPPAMVTTKPDLKNLVWAFEDALNPRYKKVEGVGRIQTWAGLWEDDARVETFARRVFAEKDAPGVRLRLWRIVD